MTLEDLRVSPSDIKIVIPVRKEPEPNYAEELIDLVKEVAKALQSDRKIEIPAPKITVQPAPVMVHPPEVTVHVDPPKENRTIEKWEFEITKRDNYGRIQHITATAAD